MTLAAAKEQPRTTLDPAEYSVATQLQAELASWWGREAGHDFAYMVAENKGLLTGQTEEAAKAALFSVWKTYHFPLVKGATFYVAPDVGRVVLAAAEKAPALELRRTDLPASVGMLYFAEPIRMPIQRTNDHDMADLISHGWVDTNDRIPIVAIAWTEASPMKLNPNGTLDYMAGARDNPAGLTVVAYAGIHEPELRVQINRRVMPWGPYDGLVPLHPLGVPFGELGTELMRGNITASVNDFSMKQLLTSLCMFMQQRVCLDTPGRPTRNARKALARASRGEVDDANVPDTRIIALRKPERRPTEGDGSREVHYQHQWMVDCHSRNQWYPSENRHKPVWISSYVKGPAGAPMLVKPKTIYAVVR